AAWCRLSFDLIIGIDTQGEELIIPYLVLLIGLITYAASSYVIERVFTQRRAIAEENARAEAARLAQEAAAEEAKQAEPGFGSSGDADDDGDEESATKADVVLPRLRPGASMRTFEDLARRIASLFAVGAGAWALLYYWGGSEIFAENGIFGLAEDLIDILFIGYIAYHAARIWIDQKIAEEGIDETESSPLDGEGGGAGATRLATLLPLIRNFVLTVILIAVALVVATELGVNVAPLFAGAGIVGLAIGFGSQALVRDILSGAFFLMDDAFRKGEYIDVGEVKGTVEKISIRSFQLRHHLGMLHTIPFGEIQHLTNFSRDWVMMKLPLRVTYDTDVERVRKLIKKLGQQLLEDPVVGENFIQPLKSQGVIHMDDSAMIIRVKFMTKPGDQWVVRKRVYQEIRELFDREGITFAHREVTVRIPDLPKDRPPNEAEIKAIGAAARQVGDTAAEGLRPTGTGGPMDDR
ncbi:MAG: mechanosensitive ion channel family protein, partial [Pseudomonadota bacterium]